MLPSPVERSLAQTPEMSSCAAAGTAAKKSRQEIANIRMIADCAMGLSCELILNFKFPPSEQECQSRHILARMTRESRDFCMGLNGRGKSVPCKGEKERRRKADVVFFSAAWREIV